MGHPQHVVTESVRDYTIRKNYSNNLSFIFIGLIILVFGLFLAFNPATTGADKALKEIAPYGIGMGLILMLLGWFGLKSSKRRHRR